MTQSVARRLTLLAFAAVSLDASAATITSTWTGGTGNWTDAGSWSNGVPQNDATNTYTALVDGGNPVKSAVTVGNAVAIDALSVDAGDQVTVTTTGSLAVGAGMVPNAGTIL